MMIHVVLHQIEIPQNAGNIMRTCAATQCKLHFIEPLGFIFDDKRVRRAGMDYIDLLDYERHVDWQDFVAKNPGQYFFLSKFATKNYFESDFTHIDEDIYLIFGSEGHGLPTEIKDQYQDRLFRVPMAAGIRSLNLSNTVALVLYEALRQNGFQNLL